MKKIVLRFLMVSGVIFYVSLIILFLLYPQYANYTEQSYLSSVRTLFFAPDLGGKDSLKEEQVKQFEIREITSSGAFNTLLLNEKILLVKLKNYNSMMIFFFDDRNNKWSCYSNFKLKDQCNYDQKNYGK